MDVKKTASGTCKVRLRVGAGERKPFHVATPNETVASARALRMQAVAAAAVRATMPPREIEVMLRALGEEETEAGFAKLEKRALLEAQQAANAPEAEPRKVASTFQELWQMWVSGELSLLYPAKIEPVAEETAKKARGRLGVMQKIIGQVSLRDFTEELADQAIAALPRTMMRSTRSQHQALIRRVLLIAVKINLLPASPLPRGWGGSVKSDRSKSFLYPSDDLRLVSCQAIEFAYRLLWGFLAREGCRLDEALDLYWRHVDLARGSVRIDKHKSRRKTGKSRVWLLEPGTHRALKWWFFELQRRELAPPTGKVFVGLEGLTEKNAAALLRDVHLHAAGVDRPELFEHNAERRQFCAHMLRDTFVTLALAQRRSEHEIMTKTGHKTSGQLHEYGAGADLARVMGFDQFLAPLDEALGLTKGAAENDGASDARSEVQGGTEATNHVPGARVAGGLGTARAGAEALRDGVQTDDAGLAGDAAGGAGGDRRVAAPQLARGGRRGDATRVRRAGPASGPDSYLNGTVARGGVGSGVGSFSRNSGKDAGPGGLLQTPGPCSGEHGAPDFADLDTAACSDEHLSPPQTGGVGSAGVGSASAPAASVGITVAPSDGQVPDPEASLAAAIASAAAKEQWGTVEMLAGLLRERQRSRLAPAVASLEHARARKAGG